MRSHVRERLQVGVGTRQFCCLFRLLVLREVANDAREKGAFARFPTCQRKLDRAFSSIFSPCGKLDFVSNDASLARREIPFEALLMGGMESFRHDQRERLSQSFRPRIAKGSLGCLVPMDDIALLVGGNDGAVSALGHCSKLFF